MAKRRIVAVVISKDPVAWKVPEIPCVNYTDGYEYYPHFPRLKTRYRIDYLARRRNNANREAVRQYPELSHFLSVDSYYVDDVNEIRQLVREYEAFGKDVILGASTWYLDPSGMKTQQWYWDTWTNPEFLQKTPLYHPPLEHGIPSGWKETKGGGGLVIVPRWAWEKQGYGIPEPFPDSGCEANYLSRCKGVKTYISFNTKAWRDPPEELRRKPYINRLRTSLAIRTRMRKLGIPDISWILWNRILTPKRRRDWLFRKVKKDGFTWAVRGLNDSHLAYDGHEEMLKGEILQQGRLFVDIGAHVGTWAIRASSNYDRVVAFEPSDRTRRMLEKNIELNHIKNIQVFRSALGPTYDQTVIYSFPHIRMNGGNSLLEEHPIMKGKGIPLNKVNVNPLDSYGFSPDFIKIDTEGYELPILKGAQETLKRTRKIIVESHRDEDVLRIRDFLAGSGFRARLIATKHGVHVVGER